MTIYHRRIRGTIVMIDTQKTVNIDMPQCKFCQSTSVVKNGKRNNVQYYLCKQCGRGFVHNKGLPKMRYPIDIVADAVYDYYAGVSLRKIVDGIAQKIGRRPSDSAIYSWVKRLTKIALAEAKKHTPQVGNKWLADECVIRLKDGKKYWLINVIDYNTRFVLASKLSRNRGVTDIKSAFETAQNKANKSPTVLLTDGWRAYRYACKSQFGSNTVHVFTTPFVKKGLSTNIVERWHGTLKDRLKPMRGMDKSDTYQLILEGFVFNFNYLRPHESLKQKTPAEAAQVTTFPYSSWLDVIKSRIPSPKAASALSLGQISHPLQSYRKRPIPKRKEPPRILHKGEVFAGRGMVSKRYFRGAKRQRLH
jgi:transposase-like protein